MPGQPSKKPEEEDSNQFRGSQLDPGTLQDILDIRNGEDQGKKQGEDEEKMKQAKPIYAAPKTASVVEEEEDAKVKAKESLDGEKKDNGLHATVLAAKAEKIFDASLKPESAKAAKTFDASLKPESRRTRAENESVRGSTGSLDPLEIVKARMRHFRPRTNTRFPIHRPGAYQGSPGEALHRNDPARCSLLQVEAHHQEETNHTNTLEQDAEIGLSSHLSNRPSDAELLAVATEPRAADGLDGSISITSAQLVEEEEVFHAKVAPNDRKRIQCAVAVFLVLLLAIIVPISVWATNQKEGTVDVVIVNTNDRSLQCGTARTHQADYRGTMNVTEGGIPCQAWDSQFPNSHAFTADRYPSAGLESNYCRNPDGDIRPWCFPNLTGHARLYCNVPFCDGELKVNNLLCGTLLEDDTRQSDYRGEINSTWAGLPCQPWEDQWPHSHDVTPEKYPSSGLESNYCRNPDGERMAWCYTMSN